MKMRKRSGSRAFGIDTSPGHLNNLMLMENFQVMYLMCNDQVTQFCKG